MIRFEFPVFVFGFSATWNCMFGSAIGVLKSEPSAENKALIRHTMDLFNSFAELSLSRAWWKIWATPTFKKFCNAEESIHRSVSNLIFVYFTKVEVIF